MKNTLDNGLSPTNLCYKSKTIVTNLSSFFSMSLIHAFWAYPRPEVSGKLSSSYELVRSTLNSGTSLLNTSPVIGRSEVGCLASSVVSRGNPERRGCLINKVPPPHLTKTRAGLVPCASQLYEPGLRHSSSWRSKYYNL